MASCDSCGGLAFQTRGSRPDCSENMDPGVLGLSCGPAFSKGVPSERKAFCLRPPAATGDLFPAGGWRNDSSASKLSLRSLVYVRCQKRGCIRGYSKRELPHDLGLTFSGSLDSRFLT